MGALLISFVSQASCLIFDRKRMLRENFKHAYIDEAAKKQWVQAQPPEYRSLAKSLADRVNIIRRTQYEELIQTGMNKILSTIPENQRIILLVPELSPGHLWTTRYAQTLVPRLRDAKIFTTYSLKAAFEGNIAGTKTHIIGIDDVAYSGVQLSDQALTLLMETEYLASRLKDFPSYQVHLFRAAGTSQSRERVIRQLKAKYIGNASALNVSFGTTIPSIGDMTDIAFAQDLRPAPVTGDLTLTLPFFKSPDATSFPRWLMNGEIIGSEKTIRFIKSPAALANEPYRKAPFKNSPLSLPDVQ